MTIYLRPAQNGDICVLLEPTDPFEIESLYQHQLRLQRIWGGFLIDNVHLTCQRFLCGDDQLQRLIDSVDELSKATHPFSMTAISNTLLDVPRLPLNILKWEITVPNALKSFAAALARKLRQENIQPLYNPGFVSSLVSALRSVPKPTLAEPQLDELLPYYLFQANKVLLSRIKGANDFEILAHFQLGVSKK